MKKIFPRKKTEAGQEFILPRRRALGLLAAAGLTATLFRPGRGGAQNYPHFDEYLEEIPLPRFFFAQLQYGRDLSWNPYPTAARSFLQVLIDRTSIPASTDRVDFRLDDPRLFRYPFLFLTGAREFDLWPEEHIEWLRTYLEFGGFLLVDDASSAPGVGFDASFQREFARLFPGESLARLPRDHTVFQSYYLLDTVAGRTQNRSYLLGLERGGFTALIYSGNDLAGAWARDRSGEWLYPVEPGGMRQRELAFRLGINIVMYALCADYKKDLIHVPFIEERRKGRKR